MRRAGFFIRHFFCVFFRKVTCIEMQERYERGQHIIRLINNRSAGLDRKTYLGGIVGFTGL